MSLKSTIIQIAKKVLFIGAQSVPAVVSAYDPPLGALIGTIIQSVMTVEAQNPGAPGDVKRETALSIVQVAAPAIEQIFASNLKVIGNPELFASGVGKLMDGLVDIFNSTGDNIKTAAPAPAK